MPRRPRRDAADLPNAPIVFTVAEVAARWRCSPGKIRGMITAGRLAAIRDGKLIRIPMEALTAFEAAIIPPASDIAQPAAETKEIRTIPWRNMSFEERRAELLRRKAKSD